MASTSLALLGQTVDPDNRIDAYNACLDEIQAEQLQYEAEEIRSAIRLARKDLRSMESNLQNDLQTLALRFLSFIFSTEDLIAHVLDQTVLSVFKDLLYVFVKADGRSCALASVIVSLEVVSIKRQNLIKRAALSLVPSLADCLSIRFPGLTLVTKEVISALGRLCKVVPDTMHVLRCSWAHCVLPIALHFSDREVQTQAIFCLNSIRPSCCLIGKQLYKVTQAKLDQDQLSRMCHFASQAEESSHIPAIWAVCIRCLGINVFANLRLWNELARIWKKCFSHGRPDISVACLESWSSVIDAAATIPSKLQDARLMGLIARPFAFMFAKNRSQHVQVSVRMKAIDIWSRFLQAAKYHKVKGEIFQKVLCPVMQKMLFSEDSAIVIAACNFLAAFFSSSTDSLPLVSQHSFLQSSQLIYDFPTDNERTRYFNDIFPHFIPLFRTLLNHQKFFLEATEFEFSAIRNCWRFFLSNFSQLDPKIGNAILKELLFDAENGPESICFMYIECIFNVLPPSVWFGDDQFPVVESPAGLICARYLKAFDQQKGATEFRLCDEWSKFTMILSSACRQHHIQHRLLLLATHFLEPIFRNVRTVSRQNVFAFVNLARATCAALCQDPVPVKQSVRYFHAICMDLLHNILTSDDLDINALINSCFRQQMQRFALILFSSITANESFPADASLLKEYEKGLIALMRSCPTLRVYTCKFLDQAFGMTVPSIQSHIVCPEQLREAIAACKLPAISDKSPIQSDDVDQEAYDAWHQLYEQFESATEKLLRGPIRSTLRSKIQERILEQRVYLDGLLSIASEISYTTSK